MNWAALAIVVPEASESGYFKILRMLVRGRLPQTPTGPTEVKSPQHGVVDRGTALSLRLFLVAVSRDHPLLPNAVTDGYL